MADVGVVILNWRNWPAVSQTIDAVLDEGIRPNQIVIVDNGSNDHSAARLRERYPDCRVLALAENRGYAAGMNAGIRMLHGDDVLLLTHECVLRPGAFRRMRERLAESAQTGVVGPLLVRADDPGVVWSAGGFLVGPRLESRHLASGDPVSKHLDDAAVGVDWLDGACLLIRHDLIEAVGTFDEGYFLYFEETDFLWRARRSGWRVECVRGAVALQQPGRQPQALLVRNRLRFLARNASGKAVARQVAFDLRVVWRLSVRHNRRDLRDAARIARGLVAVVTRTSPRRLYALG